MNSDDIANYLKTHPDFFERHAELIADLHIPHPHGGRTIPLSERQILTLRDRGKQLEGKLRELIQCGESNDAIAGKIHRLTLAVLGAGDLTAVLNQVESSLREDFAVSHVALRLWRGAGEHAAFTAVSEPTRLFAGGLAQPQCSTQAVVDTALLFGAAVGLQSYAYLPLGDSEPFGLLAMASKDAQRFYPQLGTVFLARLADIVSAAAGRYL